MMLHGTLNTKTLHMFSSGGIPFDLTEGDLIAVFSQYGEIVDVNLVRDKATGKSKGFSFIAYEDQRSTILAVDNLNGAQVAGRIIRVDHVSKYKKKEEEDEETERQKREARGVCRAFQRGECTRGASCKFSHDEQRAANTGWGPQDKGPRWEHDNFEGPRKTDKRSDKERPSESHLKQSDKREERLRKHDDDDEIERKSREDYYMRHEKRLRKNENDEFGPKSREDNHRRAEKSLGRNKDAEFDPKSKEEYHRRDEKRLRRHEDQFEPKSRDSDYRRDDYRQDVRRLGRYDDDGLEPKSRDNDDRREEKRLKRHESGSYREDNDKRGREKWSSHGRDSSSSRHVDRDDHWRKSER